MIWGLDYLGGAKYKDVILREHPEGWAAGFFTYVDGFGDSLPVVEALILTGRCPIVRLHLMWKDKHDFRESDISFVQREARRVKQLVDKYRYTSQFRISWACEHKMNSALNAKFYNAVKSILGDTVLYVNTPLKDGALMSGVINEFHGHDTKPRTGGVIHFSYDGTNCFDADVEAYKKNYASADIHFFWFPQMNGRLKTEDKTPRPKRKAWPTSNEIDSAIYLHNPKGGAALPSKWIWKSHSDRHQTPPESRAGKPVLITPVKGARVELVADNGQVVATARHSGRFTDGREMYRFSDFGFNLAEKAKRIQGHSVCKVRIGSKVYGRVNPAFRQNEYRK